MKIIHHQTIDSTNLEAKRLLNAGEKPPFLIFAAEQTEGKGQGEHIWETQAGKNLTCSFVIEPKIEPQSQYLITVAISVSIKILLEKYILQTHKIKIKWPNDIYVGDSKICGILINNKVLGNEIQSSIIGVGINVNQTEFPAHLPNPISIKLIAGEDISIDELLKEFIAIAEENFLLMQRNPQELISTYTNNLYKLNEPAMYNINGQFVERCISGIDEFGGIKG